MFLRFETLNYCTVHVLFCVLAYAIQLMDLLGAFSWRRRFAADDPNVAHLEKDDENREICFFLVGGWYGTLVLVSNSELKLTVSFYLYIVIQCDSL